MFDGGCLCGEVRYASSGPAIFSVVCHCRDCQRLSGSGGVPVLGVPRHSLHWSGPVQTFEHRGGSGHPATRSFCARCGSLLFGTSESVPEFAMIYVGSLDQSAEFRPDAAIFVACRPPWAALALPMQQHAGLPAATPDDPHAGAVGDAADTG